MTNKKEFREELLKENGIEPRGISLEDRQVLQRILKRDRARARRMKWITATVWALLLAAFAIGGVAEKLRSEQPGYLLGAVVLLYPLALYCTIALGIRAWIARNREVQFHFTEIEARLASVEEELKRLS